MQTISANQSVVKGFVRIQNKFDFAQFLLFQISDISKNSNDYWTIDVTIQAYSDVSLSPVNEDIVVGLTQQELRVNRFQQVHRIPGIHRFQKFTGF